MRRSLLLSSTAVVAAMSAALLTPGAQAGSSVSFGVPRVVDPIHVYGEPDIAINPKTGAIHASGPQGTGVQRSVWNVSVDNGDSYRIVQDLPGAATQAADLSALTPTKSADGAGGGDTEIQFSKDGQAFFTDQAGLACYTAVTTKDDGRTTSSFVRGCSASGSVDRQWISVFDPKPADHTISKYAGPRPLAYQVYSNDVCGAQIDMTTDGMDYSRSAGCYSGDTKGSPVVDQHTGDYLGPQGSGSDLYLAVGVPDALGKLTFHKHLAANRNGGDLLFPIVTEDTARNVYMVWISRSDYQVYYTWAPPRDDWSHWAKPVKINRPKAATNIFPWAQAGGPGVLDVAWYGTSMTPAQLGPQGPSAKAKQAWYVFFSQVSHAASGAPHMDQVQASPHPMHYNDICLQGTACITAQGNRNMADFFKVTIGPDGRARIIYTDSSNRLSQTVGNDSAADHSGAALDTVVTQNTGLNAWTGKPLSANDSVAPRTSITDPAGDSLLKPLGGSYIPQADIRSVNVTTSGANLVFTVHTAGGTLADAAKAAKAPFGELVVRWQMGDTLYHGVIEQDAASGQSTFFAGTTQSVDLCSVSGCKPNFLEYVAPPRPGAHLEGGQVRTGATDTSYTLSVPLADVGAPAKGRTLEEMSAFVTVSAQSFAVPLDNAKAFADEVPLQLEGTRTFNYRVGLVGSKRGGAGALPVTSSDQSTGKAAAGRSTSTSAVAAGAPVAASRSLPGVAVLKAAVPAGLATAIPVIGLLLLGAGAVLFRRRSRRQQ